MIGYTTIGSNDLPKAIAFYDALLTDLGASQVMNNGRMVIWSKDIGVGMIAVCIPFDENPATVSNGGMVALNVGSKETVERTYRRALELGATDEGPPGPRGDLLYGAYFRDLDGHKLMAFCLNG
jgi:predicted lactoylglutathione lyase